MARLVRKFFFVSLIGAAGSAVAADWHYDRSTALWNLPANDLKKIIDAPQLIVTKRDSGIDSYCRCPVVLRPHEIPEVMKRAIRAVEDQRFNERNGAFDLKGFAATALGGFRRGASTLPMQLLKNIALHGMVNQNKYVRKFIEYRYAGRFYKSLTKDEIIAAYLNQIHFGGLEAGGRDVVGVYRAVRHHFGKEPKDLGLYEAALLAGMVKAPSKYNPSGDTLQRKHAHERARLVLKLMEEQGMISKAQRLKALRDGVHRGAMPDFEIEARDFIDWVIKTNGDSLVANQPMRFFVTLDPYAQRMADNNLSELSDTGKIPSNYQAGLVMMTPAGHVQALIGSLDWSESQFNRAVDARVQPGSTAKLALLVAAVETGRGPGSPALDWPLNNGWPSNGGRPYVGWTTLADTIVQSRNAASVRLTQEIGVTRVADTARRLGLDPGAKPDVGFILGSFSTNVMQMTSAYATIANGGYRVKPRGVLAIADGAGTITETSFRSPRTQIIQSKFIAPIKEVLADVVDEGTGKKAQIGEANVYGKTGTSSGSTDAWFVGWSSTHVLGVWLGRPRSNEATPGLSGGSTPAVLFSRLVGNLLERDGRRRSTYLEARQRTPVRVRLNREQ